MDEQTDHADKICDENDVAKILKETDDFDNEAKELEDELMLSN